jgi:hypothetical protein
MCSEFDVVLSKGYCRLELKYETSGSLDSIEKKKSLRL